MVFQELAPPQSHKIKSRRDLENELFGSSEDGSSVESRVRGNEGEAAEHGIYFDDTQYDYMQHIRDLDSSESHGESCFIEAAPKAKDGKGKGKMSLEDALRQSSLQDEHSVSLKEGGESQRMDSDVVPETDLRKMTYQDQQDVPDALRGFQPDMDPRLREVLEALEDDAYVDDEEDIFTEIAKDGKEIDPEAFENAGFGETEMDDAGWETDETEVPGRTSKPKDIDVPSEPPSANVAMDEAPDHGDGDWMKEFSKFKQAEKVQTPKRADQNAELQSSIMTGTSMTGGRRKKRKGAMTSSTGYSMTSASLARTEGLTTLDARFDKIEEDYAEDDMDMNMDDGTASIVTRSSLASSQAPPLTARSDFDSIMDDFLGGYSMSGKKRLKRGGHQSGMEQLDEVRKGLGPARVKPQKA